MVSLYWTDFLELIYNPPYFRISYGNCTGASEKTLDSTLKKCGLPSLKDFRSYPSFIEKGSPEHFYIGEVLIEDLPQDVRLQIAKFACKYSITDFNQTSVDARLALLPLLREKFNLIRLCLE